MSIGDEEIFGPVLCVKRVKDFEEGLEMMNANPFANGSVIFTQNGYYSREFAKRSHGGMVGINVGIPVPVGLVPVCRAQAVVFRRPARARQGWDTILHGVQGVTTTWFSEEEKKTRVDTWDGSLGG